MTLETKDWSSVQHGMDRVGLWLNGSGVICINHGANDCLHQFEMLALEGLDAPVVFVKQMGEMALLAGRHWPESAPTHCTAVVLDSATAIDVYIDEEIVRSGQPRHFLRNEQSYLDRSLNQLRRRSTLAP